MRNLFSQDKWKYLSITLIGILATSMLSVAFQLPQQIQDTLFGEQVNAPYGPHLAYGAGALTNVFALPSNNLFKGSAFYNVGFTTATTGTIKTIEITYPGGFNVAGAKLIQSQGTGAGSISVIGQVVKYTITTPVSVTAPKGMSILIANIVNPAIASNQVSVTTKDASAVIIDGPTNSATFSLTSVSFSMLAGNSIGTTKIIDGQVMTSDLANNAVTLPKLAADAVNSTNIVDGAIQLVDLAANSVDSSKITDESITGLDVSPNANLDITNLKIGGIPQLGMWNGRISLANTLNPVDSAQGEDQVGFDNSITIGTDGLPVISYFHAQLGDLKVLHCGNAECSSGNITTTVDSTGAAGSHSSIAIGKDGLPVISYQLDGDLKVLHCGNELCNSGNTANTVDSIGSVGYYTSVIIGADGLPVISYLDATNGNLKVAHCGNTGCSSGNTVTNADTAAADVGWTTSIAIGTDGLPVISYHDHTSFDLKVLHCEIGRAHV